MSQLSPSFHPEDKSNSENETNSESESDSFSELFSFKISQKRTKHRYSPYIIPLENSPSLENNEQIATADEQITAGPSDEQITAGPSDVQITTAGSLRKR